MQFRLWLGVGVVAVSSVANHSAAASFDCQKAGTRIEKQICSSPELSKLDSDLAGIYKDALPKGPSVRADQLKWLRERNACQDAKCLAEKYKERIDELVQFTVQADREMTRQDRAAQAPAPSAANEQKPQDALQALFEPGGFWVRDAAPQQSGVGCGTLLASSDFGLSFERYESTTLVIANRMGGRHPQRNNPELERAFNQDIRVSMRIANVAASGGLVRFDRYTNTRNGAVIGDTFELDPGRKTLRKVRAHTCQGCDQAQTMAFQRAQADRNPSPYHWCKG